MHIAQHAGFAVHRGVVAVDEGEEALFAEVVADSVADSVAGAEAFGFEAEAGWDAAAVVFDFDGTILDTETPVYEAWAEAYRFAGAEPIPLTIWLEHIGKADGHGLDVRAILCQQLGLDAVPAEVERHRQATRDELVHAEPLRDGVRTWIEEAARRGVALAVASSSSSTWVRPHLARLELDGYFPVVSCADPGIPGKPDPTVYRQACAGVQVETAAALAIEDSTHGVSAALAAGMRCIAAPGPFTRSMYFDHATVAVTSLGELDPTDWF